jgi:hypothetical protein
VRCEMDEARAYFLEYRPRQVRALSSPRKNKLGPTQRAKPRNCISGARARYRMDRGHVDAATADFAPPLRFGLRSTNPVPLGARDTKARTSHPGPSRFQFSSVARGGEGRRRRRQREKQ